MSVIETPSTSAEQIVRAAVAEADRRRRAREIWRRVWRLAPAIAALALIAAAGHRWAGWSGVLPLSVLGAGFLGLAVYSYLGCRVRPVTDARAAQADADARLGGELRSASWFAANGERGDWTDFHIVRAAERVQTTDWPQLYPAIRAPRAWAATAVMIAGALALTVTLPARAVVRAGSPSAAGAAQAAPTVQSQPIVLPPELLKKLEELLAALEAGKLSPAEATARAGDLKDLLAQLGKQLDAEALKNLQNAAEAANQSGQKRVDAASLAERAKRAAADANMPAGLRKALDDLADELSKGSAQKTANADEGAPASGAKDAGQAGKGDSATAGAEATDASIQFARDAGGAGGSQAMMVSSGAASNDPRPGEGGNKGNPDGTGLLPDLAQALRRETVEASVDTMGQNVTSEVRRKTEQGRASAGYTHGAAGKFDRARAAAPPPVPEVRRAQVQSYFIRKQ